MTLKRASPGPPGPDQPVRKKTLAKDPWGRPRFEGCETIKAYEMLGKLGEGTFGEVHKARHRANGKLVALKKILMHNAKEEGFPITALREIRILKMLGHTNIIQLLEMAVERKKERVVSPRGTMYMITPYMEHDLAGLLENKDVEFSDGLVKCYLLQLLEGTKYLHELQILHRDMKAANLLIDNRGVLKIADFGLARIFDEPPPQAGHGGGRAQRDYTNCVVTRWYRPPELLLGEKRYTTAIDLWGIGCVFAEMYKRKPILQGNSDMDQMIRIFHLCGPPTQKSMPNWERLPNADGIRNMHFQRKLESEHSRMGSSGVALLSLLLCLDPLKRINAIDALKHEYFRVDPKPLKPGEVPKFNDSHELDGKKNRNAQHRGPPPAPAGGAVGGQGGGEWGAPRAGEPWTANGGGSRRPPGGDNRGNGSGPPPGRRPYDRAPAHDVRVPPSHRDGPGGHRPPWAQKASDAPIRDAGLPPRPPGPMDRDRSKPPRPRLSGGPDVDTYIPSYNSSDRGPLDGDRRVEDRRPRIPDEGRRRVTGGPDDDRRMRIPDDDRRPRGPLPLDDRRAPRDWERDRDRGGSRERFPRDRGYSAGRSTSRDPHPTEPPRDTYRR